MEIGKRIRSYREKQGLTQGDLATHAHISRISLGNYERGESRPLIYFCALPRHCTYQQMNCWDMIRNRTN